MEEQAVKPEPGIKEKILFWILLSVISTFFAEVTCANEPFAFWGLDKWIFMVPVYGFHILLLASIFYRSDRKSFSTLYILGMFFGMYEFILTKMIWMPDNEPMLRLAEVSVDWFLVLAAFWHAVVSFIIPLLVAENLAVSSSSVRNVMPRWIKKSRGLRFMLPLAVVGGLFHGVSIRHTAGLSFDRLLLSSAGNTLFLFVILLLWKKVSGNRRYSMGQLLPGGKARVVLLILMAVQYIGFFFFVRAEYRPDNIGYAAAGLIYLALWLLYRRCAAGGEAVPDTDDGRTRMGARGLARQWLAFSGLFTAVSAAFYFLPENLLLMQILWLSMIIAGGFLFTRTLVRAFRRRRPENRGPRVD